MNESRFRLRPIAAAVSALGVPAALMGASAVHAEEDEAVVEMIIVTATRRSESVQDVPFNIAAVGGDEIEQQGLDNLADVAAWVPGLHVVDQGVRSASRIVVRGLNADRSQASEALGNDGGGMVATYVGEIPLYIDLRLNDLERVEVLLGPQGTLYGAGTMGGAIRYIPAKPSVDGTEFEMRGDVYGYSESENAGADVGFTVNHALGDTLGLRVSVDYLNDPGFIDYKGVVREIGVSNPDPDLDDADAVRANLKTIEDANDEQTVSGRVALRWLPNEVIDGTLTYYFQNQETGGRTVSSADSVPVEEWESGLRVEEPNDRDNKLLALEVIADLGFAELTSATGYSTFDERGQRDQTDLLIGLEYGYELFPSFTAYTLELEEDETWSQELRLVSTGDGPFTWIVGGFYRDQSIEATSREFTPFFDQFLVDNLGGEALRPDSLEYIAVQDDALEESALFGELSYQITDAWQVTVGARWYTYDYDTKLAVDLPLLYTVFPDPDLPPRAPDEVILDFVPAAQHDDGDLWKFNTSYRFGDDAMAYATVSEGYRLGNSNGVEPCEVPLPPTQNVCAQPNELAYYPDETTNYEVGLRTMVLDGKLTLNGAAFFVDWDSPQILTATQVGLQPIIRNGEAAESRGVEFSFNWVASDRLSVRGSYSYSEAELSEDTPFIIPLITPPGFQSTVVYEDGEEGDRLPGSPEHQASLFVSYGVPVMDGYVLDVDYGVSYVSDVLTQIGERGAGESLDGYAIHDLAFSLSSEQWTATLYAQNLFDEYAETSARGTRNYVQSVTDIDGGLHAVRTYYHDVVPPLQIGLRMTWTMM
jgi:outer membrane receptor protein involved in Fe transport